MQCGQTMSAIDISNTNQSDLVQCVYSTTCSFPNHTTHISVIFMHAWVSNIRISYSNIWIQLYIDCDLTYSAILLHPHSSLLFIIVPLTFSRACMHTHTTSRHYPSHACNLFLQVGLPWRHTPTHIPLSIISGILYLSRVHAQRSMFLYVCVYIARSFIVFHTNRSIDISSEVSPSFPRPHWSIYTSLYRINIYS